jgi:hypothetical protein
MALSARLFRLKNTSEYTTLASLPTAKFHSTLRSYVCLHSGTSYGCQHPILLLIGALENKCYTLLGSDNSLKPTRVEMERFLLACEVWLADI